MLGEGARLVDGPLAGRLVLNLLTPFRAANFGLAGGEQGNGGAEGEGPQDGLACGHGDLLPG